MSGLQNSIQTQERMIATMSRVTQTVSFMTSAFETSRAIVGQGINMASWETARQVIIQTSAEVTQYREALEQAASVPPPTPSEGMEMSGAIQQLGQIDHVVNSIERDTQDNTNAQENYNQSVGEGTGLAEALQSKILDLGSKIMEPFSIQNITSFSDQLTRTNARLDAMNDGLQSSDQMTQKIFESAKRARTPFMETADTIANMGISAGNAFQSNDEMIAFVEQMNKQFVIGGASAQQQADAMNQLTQAMASGALSSGDLNTVLSAAPGIAGAIEKNMGWAGGSIMDYADQGAVSAQIVKDSLLNMSQETNDKFNSIPMTFEQLVTNISTDLLQTFLPVIETIGNAAGFISDHWSAIGPVFYGAVAGILAAALAFGVLNLVMSGFLINPATWIILGIAAAIGVVVAMIMSWVQSVGGLKVAWLTCVDFIMTWVDKMILAFVTAWVNIQNAINNMSYGFEAFKVGVLNTLGNLKVKGLLLLQSFINGAIDSINDLIKTVKRVAGISIELIEPVEFGTKAELEEKAIQSQRMADLAADREAADTENQARNQRAADFERQAAAASAKRHAEIEAAKNDSAGKAAGNDDVWKAAGGDGAGSAAGYDGAGMAARNDYNNIIAGGAIEDNTGRTASNTAAMTDSMDMMDEELKYMRDAAEQEIINRFTLADLKVDVKNNNKLTKKTDFDDMGRYLSAFTNEFLASSAEGGHL